ncbi:MAG: DNRLRE domain-containing protein [Firmicutes bacterium]|nr:DNRLRE domain-containing protein [Bacillota bacterium]
MVVLKRLVTIMIVFSLVSIPMFAVGNEHVIIALDERIVAFDNLPFINANGRTMVPVRFATQNLGMKIDFKPLNKEVVVASEDSEVIFSLGKKEVIINGVQQEIDTPPVLIEGRTYIPLTVLAETFGYDVEWQGNMNLVKLSSGGALTEALPGTSINPDEKNYSKFFAQSNGKDYIGNREKRVMAFVMGVMRNPEVSGRWRKWSDAGREGAHIPDNAYPDGKRDIGAVHYPSVGLYDNSDPDYVEYQMQLFKMTYIDSISFYFIKDDDWHTNTLENITVPLMKKYNIEGVGRTSSPQYFRTVEKQVGAEDMMNHMDKYMKILEPVALKIDGRQVFTLFDTAGIDNEHYIDWKNRYQTEPFLMRWVINTFGSEWTKRVSGIYDWVGAERDEYQIKASVLRPYSGYYNLEEAMQNHTVDINRAIRILESEATDYYAASVSPGFDDVGVWGWGTSPKKIERGEDAELYKFKWEQVLNHKFPMVVIPTWDDWCEGSTIEPALEYGNLFIELTRKYAAAYKGITPNDGNLNLPGWIYKIRKTTSDLNALSDAKKACNLIAEEKYKEAEKLIKPYVELFSIPDEHTLFDGLKTPPKLVDYPVERSEEIRDGSIPVKGEKGEVVYYPIEDAFVRDGSARSSNFGDQSVLTVKSDATGYNRETYLKFDTSNTILDNFSSAKLKIYISNIGKDNRELSLYATSNDWSELELIWENKPENKEMLATFSANRVRQWIEIDLSEYVRTHYGKIFSIKLVNDGSPSAENQISFSSREDVEQEPCIIIK